MEFQSYNSELAIASLLFKRLFQNIRIQRTADNGEKKEVLVQCVLGQRSRIMKSLENPERRGNYKVPMIAINRTGYSRNGDRVNNLNNEVKYEITSKNRLYHLMTPVPVDINYEVSVIAKYQADIDKIASNFMVFFNSDLFVTCQHPKYEGIKMNNQVVMQDSVSEEHQDEISPDQDDLITSNFQFTFKTFLFPGMQQFKARPATILSSYQIETLSDVVHVLRPDEIDAFQKKYPMRSVSVLLPETVTADISVEIPNPDLSGEPPGFDDGIPTIRQIDFGFYAVPERENFESYMMSVDTELLVPHTHRDISGYISSDSYLSDHLPKIKYDPYREDESMASAYSEGEIPGKLSVYDEPLKTSGDYYAKVNSDCSLYPYKDPIYWRINPLSKNEFPDNVEIAKD